MVAMLQGCDGWVLRLTIAIGMVGDGECGGNDGNANIDTRGSVGGAGWR